MSALAAKLGERSAPYVNPAIPLDGFAWNAASGLFSSATYTFDPATQVFRSTTTSHEYTFDVGTARYKPSPRNAEPSAHVLLSGGRKIQQELTARSEAFSSLLTNLFTPQKGDGTDRSAAASPTPYRAELASRVGAGATHAPVPPLELACGGAPLQVAASPAAKLRTPKAAMASDEATGAMAATPRDAHANGTCRARPMTCGEPQHATAAGATKLGSGGRDQRDQRDQLDQRPVTARSAGTARSASSLGTARSASSPVSPGKASPGKSSLGARNFFAATPAHCYQSSHRSAPPGTDLLGAAASARSACNDTPGGSGMRHQLSMNGSLRGPPSAASLRGPLPGSSPHSTPHNQPPSNGRRGPLSAADADEIDEIDGMRYELEAARAALRALGERHAREVDVVRRGWATRCDELASTVTSLRGELATRGEVLLLDDDDEDGAGAAVDGARRSPGRAGARGNGGVAPLALAVDAASATVVDTAPAAVVDASQSPQSPFVAEASKPSTSDKASTSDMQPSLDAVNISLAQAREELEAAVAELGASRDACERHEAAERASAAEAIKWRVEAEAAQAALAAAQIELRRAQEAKELASDEAARASRADEAAAARAAREAHREMELDEFLLSVGERLGSLDVQMHDLTALVPEAASSGGSAGDALAAVEGRLMLEQERCNQQVERLLFENEELRRASRAKGDKIAYLKKVLEEAGMPQSSR